jgi:hypothetical protein
LNVTPLAKSDPVGCKTFEFSPINSLTDWGAAPVESRNQTAKVKVVAVVPDPGLAVPFRMVTVPQVCARTGSVSTRRAETANQPASARMPASHSLDRPRGATAGRPKGWAMARG